MPTDEDHMGLVVVNFLAEFDFILIVCPLNAFVCFVSAARHILSEKQGKINEAYKKLQDGWLDNGDKVPPAEFAKVLGFSLVFLYALWFRMGK